MNLKSAIGAVVMTGLLVAGCGGESDEDRAVNAVSVGLTSDPSLASYGITREQGDCLGEYLVDELGAESVLDLGADEAGVFANVPDEAIATLGNGLETCVENIETITRDLLTQNLPTAAESAGGTTVTTEQSACIADEIVGEVPLARLIAIGSGNDSDTATPLTVSEATTFATAYVSCTDARADVLAEVEAQGATPDEVACFDANLSDADLVERFSAAFLGEEPPDTFAAATTACF